MNTLTHLLSLNDDERLLAEVRTYQEKLISNAEEPIWEICIAYIYTCIHIKRCNHRRKFDGKQKSIFE